MSKPVPTHLKLLRGNPGHRPIKQEPQPTPLDELTDAPPFLLGYAVDEWHRVVPELQRMRIATVVDIQVLAAYCQAYGRWRLAEETITRMGAGDLLSHGMLMKTGGVPARNPMLRVAAEAAYEMVRYAGELGFTPVARVRLAGGTPTGDPPPGKFDGFLAG